MADQDGLLLRALQYEEGHPRRSGHILKVGLGRDDRTGGRTV